MGLDKNVEFKVEHSKTKLFLIYYNVIPVYPTEYNHLENYFSG